MFAYALSPIYLILRVLEHMKTAQCKLILTAQVAETSLVHYTASDVHCTFVCLFVCLFALRPMSTAMVIAGRSVHLTTLFPGQA